MSIVAYLTPTNCDQEKERFLNSASYHPVFTYDWENPKYRSLATDSSLVQLLTEVNAQNYGGMIAAAAICFSSPVSLPALSAARLYLKEPPVAENPVPIAEVINRFHRSFEQLGLSEYSIEVQQQPGFNFRPLSGTRTLVMSATADLRYLTLNGEIKHELTHILRTENGRFNAIPRATKYLPTEEGLASYFQDFSGEGCKSSLYQHAAEYAVTEVLLQGSLRQGYEYFRSLGFPAELSWQRVSRHKFGWRDTKEPGDIMKPSMYFLHEMHVSELSEKERLRLMVGKITVDELDEYPEYVGRVSLSALEDFYQV